MRDMHRWCTSYAWFKVELQTKVQAKSPQAKGFHCTIHRYALACKTLPISLIEVLNLVIKIVNFVKGSALNSRLFKVLCRDINKLDVQDHMRLAVSRTQPRIQKLCAELQTHPSH